jgi:hypothetical protein
MYNTYRSKQFIFLAYKSRVGPFAVPLPLTRSETKSMQTFRPSRWGKVDISITSHARHYQYGR